jgi:hypothetical protein
MGCTTMICCDGVKCTGSKSILAVTVQDGDGGYRSVLVVTVTDGEYDMICDIAAIWQAVITGNLMWSTVVLMWLC